VVTAPIDAEGQPCAISWMRNARSERGRTASMPRRMAAARSRARGPKEIKPVDDLGIPVPFEALLRPGGIRSLYQPLVHLATGRTIGFEALARGPAHSRWHQPEPMITHAMRVGRLAELDWYCRAAACRDALDSDVFRHVPLFLNIEPTTADFPCPADLVQIFAEAGRRLQLVAEITERSAAASLDALVATITDLRSQGVRIALDDVGAEPGSERLLDLLRPDVIKLDRTIIRRPTSRHSRSIVKAVRHHIASIGAILLVEGIETDADREQASRLGAALGQGFLLGRPGPIPKEMAGTPVRLPWAANAIDPLPRSPRGCRPQRSMTL
jgi:EAL domain-containing protein (putative c-di-GMP-specific phosphodiesterase class I)